MCTFFRGEESAHADRDIAIMKYMAKHKAQACVRNSRKLCGKNLCLIRSKNTVYSQYMSVHHTQLCVDVYVVKDIINFFYPPLDIQK